MSKKVKSELLYFAAMVVLFCGGITMVGHGMKGGEMAALFIWAISYGGLLAGPSLYYERQAGS